MSNEYYLLLSAIQKRIAKFVAILLVIFTIGSSCVPVQRVYGNVYDFTEQTQDVENEEDDKVVYRTTEDEDFDVSAVDIKSEIVDLRSPNTKTFIKKDGTYIVAIYDEVIHYLSNGVYKDIDNTLIYDVESDSYANLANEIGIRFPNKLDSNKPIKLSLSDYDIEWEIEGAKRTSSTISTDVAPSEDIKQLTKISRSVFYDDVFVGVDIQYTVNSDSVKENIIVDRYITNFSLSFTYTTGKLLLVITDETNYAFVTSEGEEVFHFDPLVMYDSASNASDKVALVVQEVKKGEYSVTIIPDDEWMKTAVYPVTIDPIISSAVQSMSIYDTYVSEANPTTNYSTSDYIWISGTTSTAEYRGLLYFILPTSVMDKVITYSYLTLSRDTANYTAGRVIGLYANNTTFTSSTVTWNTKPSHSTSMTDFHVTDTNGKYIFDITSAVIAWQATGSTTTKGFTIKDKYDFGANNRVYSLGYDDVAGLKPVVEIGYIDPAGLKDFWTYSSQDVGLAGTGYVSDRTGYLTYVRDDIAFGTDKQSLSLSFAYNILARTTDVGYGKGWNINYNNKLGYDSTLALYYLTDYTGNKVYYHAQSSCDERINPALPEVDYCYLAEDGSGNVLVRAYAYGYFGNQYILTDDQVKYNFGTDYYLDSILDPATSLSLTIARNSSALDKVTQITDQSGNQIVITYSVAGVLESATLKVKQTNGSLRDLETVLYFDNDSISGFAPNVVQYRKNYLSSETMTTYDEVNYVYDTSYRLTGALIPSEEHIVYSFSATHKVATISSAYDTSAFGLVTYTYAQKITTITRDSGSEDPDDYVIYKFDDYGHTVNIIDSNSNTQFFHYINLFSDITTYNGIYTQSDGTPNYQNNHKLVSKSNPQLTNYNPIINSGFEYNTLSDGCDWELMIDAQGGASVEAEYLRDEEEALMGGYAGEINVGDSTDDVHLEQTVTLDIGAYSLIGFIKNETDSDVLVYASVTWQSIEEESDFIDNNGEWSDIGITFYVTAENTPVTISLFNHAYGHAYYDNFQIVEGFIDTRANMLDNPSFEVGDTSGNFAGWYTSFVQVDRVPISSFTDGIYEDILGDYGAIIDGSATEARWATAFMQQYADTTYLHQRGEMIVGGWAYSNGTPTTLSSGAYLDQNYRYFRIRVDFMSNVGQYGPETTGDLLVGRSYVNFDPSVIGWQYTYATIPVPEGYFRFVNLFIEYQGEGQVNFDGAQIFLESDSTNYEYNSQGQIERIITSTGDVTEYSYDDTLHFRKNPEQITMPDGTIVEVSSDNDNVVDQVGYNNVSSTPTYNSYGQVSSMRVGDEDDYFTTSTAFVHLSQYVGSTTDEFGKTTEYTNDYLTGLLTAIENAKGQDTHYIYNNDGTLSEVRSVGEYTDPESSTDAKVEYIYDTSDRLSYIILDTNFSYHITYDSQGRMETVYVNTQPLMTYTYEMDGTYYSGLMSTQTYGNGDIIKLIYNDLNQISQIQFANSTSPTNFVTRFGYEYDQFGRIAVYSVYRNGVIAGSEYYTYNSSNQLVHVTDESGNDTDYIYDDQGNLTSLHFDINDTESTTNYRYNECFLYDEEDVCTQISSLYDNTEYDTISGNDILKNYHYEVEGLYRLSYISLLIDSVEIQQKFTFVGNTTRVSKIEYDIIDITGTEYTYSYLYDELGNIIQVSYSEGTTLKTTNYYQYDELNQLVIEDYYVVGTGTYSTVYSYDSRGNRTSVYQYYTASNLAYRTTAPSVPGSSLVNNGSRSVIPYYNSIYPYTTVKSAEIGGDYPTLTFRYKDDSTGVYYTAETDIQSTNFDTLRKGFYTATYTAESPTYGIDVSFNVRFNVGHLATSTIAASASTTYQYSTGWLDQLASYVTMVGGNSVSHVLTYDGQGNPTQITNFKFNSTTYNYASLVWDGRQLASIVMIGSYGPLYKVDFEYNDQGYRTAKIKSSWVNYAWSQTERIDYELIDDKVVYETNGTYGLLFTYDYDGKIISFNGDLNVNDSTPGQEYFYLRNQQGDITTIVDESFAAIVKYRYDAYGNTTVVSDTSGGIVSFYNPYTYRGYRYDSDIGMYYLNSRYYNPQIGRFLNGDGLLGETGNILSTNMYTYCANNPVMYIDITGYIPSWLKLALVAVAVVAVVAVAIAAVGIGVVAAATVIYAVASNISEIVQTENFIDDNNDIGAMTSEEYSSVIADGNTIGLSEAEKLAYIRYLREYGDNAGSLCENWTEGQMLREFNYHDQAYYFFHDWLGISDNEFPSSNTKYVDFENPQTARTFIFRFFGNMIP